MVFADWFGDAYMVLILIGVAVYYAIRGIAKSAKDVTESDEFREGVWIGLWFLADDDDDYDDDYDD